MDKGILPTALLGLAMCAQERVVTLVLTVGTCKVATARSWRNVRTEGVDREARLQYSSPPVLFKKECPVSIKAWDHTTNDFQNLYRSLYGPLVNAQKRFYQSFLSTLSKEAGPWIIVG